MAEPLLTTPYVVEKRPDTGCKDCSRGVTFDVVGPMLCEDGTLQPATHHSTEDADDAAFVCDQMNDAYRAGTVAAMLHAMQISDEEAAKVR
jgi:hypothetical protein